MTLYQASRFHDMFAQTALISISESNYKLGEKFFAEVRYPYYIPNTVGFCYLSTIVLTNTIAYVFDVSIYNF